MRRNKEFIERKSFAKVALLASCLILVVTSAQAQSNSCSILLQHGVFDVIRQQSGQATSSQSTTQICTAYNQLHQDNSRGSGEVSVLGFGGGSVQFSREQLEVIGSSMCGAASSDAQASRNLSVYQQVVSRDLVNAFNRCIDLQNAGLNITTDFHEDSPGTLAISMRYQNPPGVTRPVRLRNLLIDQPNDGDPSRRVTCDGDLARSAREQDSLDTQVLGMTCRRPIVADPVNAFFSEGKRVLASAVRITVDTTAGQMTLPLAGIEAGPPAIEDLPVGAVIPMFLNPAQIAALSPKWCAANGGAVADPQSRLNGRVLPDLIGRFILGAQKTDDVTSTDASKITGGSSTISQTVTLKGRASKVAMPGGLEDRTNSTITRNDPPRFVIDTRADELDVANHTHQVVISDTLELKDVMPPFRRLVYMVKCR